MTLNEQLRADIMIALTASSDDGKSMSLTDMIGMFNTSGEPEVTRVQVYAVAVELEREGKLRISALPQTKERLHTDILFTALES